MKGFLINLDSSEDRLRQVEGRLFATGFVRVSDSPVRWRREALVIERIPAVDGRKLSESELLKWRQRERPFWDWTTHELTPGEIGCFLSHREFWQKVVDERLSHAFVLEDDILLADDCFKILSSADWIPSDADFVKLNLFPTNSTHTYPVSKPVGLVEGREIRRTAGRIYGTGCYVITEAAARECLEHSGKLSLPVDLFMFDSRFSFATEKKIGSSDFLVKQGARWYPGRGQNWLVRRMQRSSLLNYRNRCQNLVGARRKHTRPHPHQAEPDQVLALQSAAYAAE